MAVPRFVFVVTYGRSGSTLVQGLLNAMPGVLVRGENNLFVLPLFRSWDALASFQEEHAAAARAKGVRSAFYGLDEMRPDQLVEAARDVMLSQLVGTVGSGEPAVLGFKEVLWHRIRPRETARFFDFFEQVFPDARYILHQRQHDAVAASGFWKRERPDAVAQALQRVETIQDHLRSTRPDRVLDTRYERLVDADPATIEQELRGLAEFVLGQSTPELLRDLHATLQLGHGPNPSRGNPQSTR